MILGHESIANRFRRALERVRVDGEAVILRGDLDFSRGQIHDRLIAAVVAEF